MKLKKCDNKAESTRFKASTHSNYRISIIIPVLHEETIINRAISAIFDLPYDGEVEVIVVDGSPEGDTLSAIENRQVLKVSSKKGRAHQMNKGAANACGDILIFLHADTELPKNALNTISSVMRTGGFVGGAFDLGIQSGRNIFRLIEIAASLRSRYTGIPYGDQAIFMRKEYFHSIGDFKEIPLMEDVELMRRVKKTGDKIYIISEKVRTSPRRWEKEGVIYCTFRNWILITLYSLGMPAEKLLKFYK
ncbi:MAG TPA: TIGR04283 family arsenosugar biosynthesis glycosyltransferase [Dissulfurispiraceae bacterium]|nr:TIGR04283 family arsenosugar biosynthesis glycosyltransferase [Dissulfurispiraceae bacterium]